MAAVSPTSTDIEFSQGPVRLLSRLTKSLSRWFRLIFGRLPGEYTVAKLDAFDCFRRETTPAQVAAILFLTPMSSILINFIIESIPLNDPATGFRGCLPFLLRNFVTATIVTMVPFRIKPDCISELSIPSWKLALGFGILLGTVSTGTIAALIYIIKDFPVPSSQFSPMIPMGIIGRLIETKILQKPEVKPRLAKIDLWLGMVVVPIFIYPISTAFFMALEPRHQFWFSLVLPVIKHLVRYLLWVAARDDLDLVGSVVCAIGHFYHILFTAMCLQNAKNLKTLIAVVIVNLIHMIFNCREIVKDAYKIKSQLQDLCSTETHDIVSTALNIAQKERVSRSLHHKHPSRFSSQYPRYQGVDFVARHHTLFAQHSLGPTTELADRIQNKIHRSSMETLIYPVNAIVPGTAPIQPPAKEFPSKTLTTRLNSKTLTGSRKHSDVQLEERFVRSVTSALHQAEFILLRSYITMFGLSFYGFYLMLVFWLSNNRYFATMANVITFNDVTNMVFHLLILCTTELVFFVVYLAIIHRFLRVSGIHLLAFVLWSQRILIQGKFVMLSVMILGFPLEHYGNGYIFHLHPHN